MGSGRIFFGSAYVELNVDEMPRDIAVEGDSAQWSVRLVDGTVVTCRLRRGSPHAVVVEDQEPGLHCGSLS